MAEPVEFVEFTSAAYQLETVNAACSRMVNLYPEVIEKGPRQGKLRLRQVPGFKAFCTLPVGPTRCLLDIDGGNRLFAVAGPQVYEVFRDGTYRAFTGTIALNNHPVIMVANGINQIALASGGMAYLIEGETSGPGTVTPIDFITPDGTSGGPVMAATITFLDNYFIANQTPTIDPSTGLPVSGRTVYVSNLAPDGGIWDPADAKIKEGLPDNVCRVFADNQQLWVFGFDGLEIWVDTGELFPFNGMAGAVLRIGCSAPYSVAGARGWRFWLWKNSVYAAYGIDPQRVSDSGVEEAIKTYGDVSDAEAWCEIDGAHVFYVISFPGASKTWVYDLSTKAWHERSLWKTGRYERYRGRVYAKAFNMDLVGDTETGDIWQLDPKTYTDADGLPLRRLRTAPYLTENMRMVRYNRLIVDMDTGIGADGGTGVAGDDPTAAMRFSNDRGKTWSAEVEERLGKIGETSTRVVFRCLGGSRIGRTFELVVSSPVPLSINTAYLDIGAPEAAR